MSTAMTLLWLAGLVLIVATALRELAIHSTGMPGTEQPPKPANRHAAILRAPLHHRAADTAARATRATSLGLMAAALAALVGIAAGFLAVVAAVT